MLISDFSILIKKLKEFFFIEMYKITLFIFFYVVL